MVWGDLSTSARSSKMLANPFDLCCLECLSLQTDSEGSAGSKTNVSVDENCAIVKLLERESFSLAKWCRQLFTLDGI